MSKTRTIKSLYSLALAEGEGVGTAYEYIAKRLLLLNWLDGSADISHVLIAGLPEKYGCSLDFILLAEELKAKVLVIEDRPQALDKLSRSIEAAREFGWFSGLTINTEQVADLSRVPEEIGVYGLCLSSEVLQRLTPNGRSTYLDGVKNLATRVALFAPNAANPAHTEISGLRGIHLSELKQSFGNELVQAGYIDMPPFPPGITRSQEQRARASEGWIENLVMGGLGLYVRLERFLPTAIRKRQSHIVYAYASA